MDCGKVRDQFSSLLEGELNCPDREEVKEHLASCPRCGKEWDEFRRLVDWLHSAGEEEAPDGFLSEVRKKLDERKGEPKWKGFFPLRSMKIPLQAMAMVTFLFITLYLTRMPPFETVQKREIEKPGAVISEIEKKEGETAVSPGPSAAARKVLHEPPRSAERPKNEAASPPPEKPHGEGERMKEGMISLAKRPALEMTLKITNREIALERVRELAMGLGGEVAVEEENVLLTFLPASSFPEFEKGFTRIGSSFEGQGAAARGEKKNTFSFAQRAKMKSFEEKERAPSPPAGEREDRILIRIRLSPE